MKVLIKLKKEVDIMEKLEQSYEDLINALMNRNIKDLENEKVYINFMDLMLNELRYKKYFDYDQFERVIDRHLKETDYSEELNNIPKHIDSLIDEIVETFQANVANHYILCPLQNSKLDKDIVFNDFFFIKNRDSEEEYIETISNYIRLSEEDVKEMIDHTHNTRSKDFIKDNMLIFKIKNQTNTVKTYAITIIEDIFNFIRVLYHYNELSTSIIHSARAYWNEPNKHVLILAEDDWRRGHGYRGSNINFNLDININFLNDSKNQKKLVDLIKKFTINYKIDSLDRLFYNAVNLFNRAINYKNSDNDVSILLMMTTAETLLTQDKNEKRLRLSAIIPRIINHDKLNGVDVAKLLNDYYLKRNNFVHSGFIKTDFEDKDNDQELYRIISKLIIYYFSFIETIDVNSSEKRIKQWESFVNTIFEDVIFGKDKRL